MNKHSQATMILDDFQYLDLCKNIKEYMSTEFSLTDNIIHSKYRDQTGCDRNMSPSIEKNYPILTNKKIDIHAIHDNHTVLSKFLRRKDRFIKIVESDVNYKIFCVMTYTNMFLIHDNPVSFINNFLENNDKDEKIIYLFLGPKLKGCNHKNYITCSHMSLNIERKKNNVSKNVNFGLDSNIITNYIKQNFIKD